MKVFIVVYATDYIKKIFKNRIDAEKWIDKICKGVEPMRPSYGIEEWEVE